jgi:hypothetical protein
MNSSPLQSPTQKSKKPCKIPHLGCLPVPRQQAGIEGVAVKRLVSLDLIRSHKKIKADYAEQHRFPGFGGTLPMTFENSLPIGEAGRRCVQGNVLLNGFTSVS